MKKCRYCGAEPKFKNTLPGHLWLGCSEAVHSEITHSNYVIIIVFNEDLKEARQTLIKRWNRGNSVMIAHKTKRTIKMVTSSDKLSNEQKKLILEFRMKKPKNRNTNTKL